MRPLHLTRAGLLGTLGVFLVAAACIRLGFWQLDRRAQRLDRNAAVAERLDQPRILLRQWPGDTTGLGYRLAEVVGRFDNAHAMVLAGRSYGGAPGVHVLVPLQWDGGAILVNRGWVPAPDAATADLQPLARTEELRVEGVLLPFPELDAGNQGRSSDFQQTWFRFDGGSMREQLSYPTPPLYLLATARPEATADAALATTPDTARALPVILDPPTLDPGPHLSYAIQWFSFAGIFLVGWVVILIRRTHPA